MAKRKELLIEIDEELGENDLELAEAIEIVEEASQIDDEAAKDETVTPVQYEVSSYGADFDVEGLVKRLERKEVFIPPFQRAFVWKEAEASRFIESLLLGLPVPGVFLAKEPDSNRLLVIDGQQRLKTLLYFFKGEFNPNPESSRRNIFRLTKVQEPFLNCTYADLKDKDRIKLNDSIIHATIVKQESPAEDSTGTSIYHIFERLNNGGRRLAPQEIRAAIFHGELLDLLVELNETPSWREIFGAKNKRLKDQEMILRFLAFVSWKDNYSKPMTEFLNSFAKNHRNPTKEYLDECRNIFGSTMTKIFQALGKAAFRPERTLNVAVYDSVSYAVAKAIQADEGFSDESLKAGYSALLANPEFEKAISSGTSDENNVATRLRLSEEAFGLTA